MANREKMEAIEELRNPENLISKEFMDIVVLKDACGLTWEEISVITSLRISTLKSRYKRGKHKIGLIVKDLRP